MLKKTLAAAVVAGALLFGGASAASAANDYPADDARVTAPTTAVAPGAPVVVTFDARGISPLPAEVGFSVTGPQGANLASIVAAATSTTSITKPVSNGTASTTFTATAPGTYTVTGAAGGITDAVTITVAAGAAAADPSLPATGGELSTAALWVGAGALGLGGLAVVAATARRRAAQR